MLLALAEKRIGRRDQANAWIWRLAGYTRDVHEEYAVQRWPETKRLLGLLVNSSGAAHARNARRLVHGARKHDRRLSAALLAAAIAHTPEGEEILRGARTRMARKPSALSRELLRNFPKSRGRRGNRRRRKKGAAEGEPQAARAHVASPSVIARDDRNAKANSGQRRQKHAQRDEKNGRREEKKVDDAAAVEAIADAAAALAAARGPRSDRPDDASEAPEASEPKPRRSSSRRSASRKAAAANGAASQQDEPGPEPESLDDGVESAA
jgi:hypothetical protein